jgi:ferritin-like metal-binding protein YciE
MKTLKDALVHTLQDIYYAETAIAKALPKVISATTNAALKKALQEHLGETKGQVAHLKKAFKALGETAKGEKCDAIEGLIKECEGAIDEAKGAVAKHAMIIGCCQAIEHYEIARYGTMREWAKALGNDEVHAILSTILDQEKAANNKLTAIAVESINKA